MQKHTSLPIVREAENSPSLISRAARGAMEASWPLLRAGLFELDAGIQVQFDLARTALALERFRLPTGARPERMEELVPRYLPQVPLDPFDGQPIRYRRRQAGYLLYSVGPDGQDNDGREQDEVKSGEPCDWCFIVVR